MVSNISAAVFGTSTWITLPFFASMARWRAILMSPDQPSATQTEPLAMSLM